MTHKETDHVGLSVDVRVDGGGDRAGCRVCRADRFRDLLMRGFGRPARRGARLRGDAEGHPLAEAAVDLEAGIAGELVDTGMRCAPRGLPRRVGTPATRCSMLVRLHHLAIATIMLAGCSMPNKPIAEADLDAQAALEAKVSAELAAQVKTAVLDMARTIRQEIHTSAGRDSTTIVNQIESLEAQLSASKQVTLVTVIVGFCALAVVMALVGFVAWLLFRRDVRRVGYTPENWVRKEQIRGAIVKQANGSPGATT